MTDPVFDNPVLSCCGHTLMSHDYDGCHGKRWDGSGCSCNAHQMLLAHLADVSVSICTTCDGTGTHLADADKHCPHCAGTREE